MFQESFEITRGDFSTTFSCKFNKEGRLVSYTVNCQEIKSSRIMETLKEELMDAIEKEEFEKATEIQIKINKLRNLEESKNQL